MEYGILDFGIQNFTAGNLYIESKNVLDYLTMGQTYSKTLVNGLADFPLIRPTLFRLNLNRRAGFVLLLVQSVYF